MTHHRRGSDRNRLSPRQALEHFRSTGQTENAAILARLLDRDTQPDPVTARRQRTFTPEVVDFLEQQDRRRDAARRCAPICCPFSGHAHTFGCFDPVMASTG